MMLPPMSKGNSTSRQLVVHLLYSLWHHFLGHSYGRVLLKWMQGGVSSLLSIIFLLSGDHATKLFKTMVPDSKLVRFFGCGHM